MQTDFTMSTQLLDAAAKKNAGILAPKYAEDAIKYGLQGDDDMAYWLGHAAGEYALIALGQAEPNGLFATVGKPYIAEHQGRTLYGNKEFIKSARWARRIEVEED